MYIQNLTPFITPKRKYFTIIRVHSCTVLKLGGIHITSFGRIILSWGETAIAINPGKKPAPVRFKPTFGAKVQSTVYPDERLPLQKWLDYIGSRKAF